VLQLAGDEFKWKAELAWAGISKTGRSPIGPRFLHTNLPSAFSIHLPIQEAGLCEGKRGTRRFRP
jgi:hypothetical protein